MNKENLIAFKKGLEFLVEETLKCELVGARFNIFGSLIKKPDAPIFSEKLYYKDLDNDFWCSFLNDEDFIDRKVGNKIFDINYGDYWWLFDAEWRYRDNSITGLIKRVDILVNEGLPINWLNQLSGKMPLQYVEQDLEKNKKVTIRATFKPSPAFNRLKFQIKELLKTTFH